jgi:hypothetical protein
MKPHDEAIQMSATAIQPIPETVGKTSKAKAKAADVVVPIKPPKDIPDVQFPGGYVSTVGPGQVNVVVDPPNGAKIQGGSDWPAFNTVLLESVLATIFPTTDAAANRLAAANAALGAFRPVDEIEGMLAGQAVGLHHAAMECLRRGMLPDQHPDVASRLRRDAANLARSMTDMLDALDRKRGKGPQVVRVERVVVHEGGQAIVGNVQPAAARVGEG